MNAMALQGWAFALGFLIGAACICALVELPQSAAFFAVSATGWAAGRMMWR